jgi:hypothetical protein
MASTRYVLHPLLLTNVADHLDRATLERRSLLGGGSSSEAPKNPVDAPLCGMLFGTQTAQKVEIFSCLESHVVLGGGIEDPTSSPSADPSGYRVDEEHIKSWILPDKEKDLGPMGKFAPRIALF